MAASEAREPPGPPESAVSLADIVRADGHLWLKYGQKKILNTSIIRCYYKCYSSKNKGPCRAKKTVDYDRHLPVSSSTIQTNYTNRTHNHSTPLNLFDSIAQDSCRPNVADSCSIAQGCSPNSAKSTSCNPNAVVTTNTSLTSPPTARNGPEQSAIATSDISRGEIPVQVEPIRVGNDNVSSSFEAGPVQSDLLSNAAEAGIATTLFPQSAAVTGSGESAALAPMPTVSLSFPLSSCESLATECGTLSDFFDDDALLDGRWPCAAKRVRLTPFSEATSIEDVSNSAGHYYCSPSSSFFEAASVDLDQVFGREPGIPPTPDAAVGSDFFDISFEDGLAAVRAGEGRVRELVSADLSLKDFLPEEPPWLEAMHMSPSWGEAACLHVSSFDGNHDPHPIRSKRCASALLIGSTETGDFDGNTPGHACVPRPMPTSGSVHSVFSFLGGGDTLNVVDLV